MDLKDLYSTEFIRAVGAAFHQEQPTFDPDRLLSDCQQTDWDDLKLMQRRDRLTMALHQQLPSDFTQAAPTLLSVGQQFTGLAAICFPNYVATYGLADWSMAMTLLGELTKYSSAEFAIRPFLLQYPTRTARQMVTWAQSADVDQRRLASEGMRPRLPWGVRLKPYVADPQPIFDVLKLLMADSSQYVQTSVANNLNDISKDHPEQVIHFVRSYWQQRQTTDWLIKKGLRTLFKQGNPAVLDLLGYDPQVAARVVTKNLSATQQVVRLGATSSLAYQLTITGAAAPVYLGYRVHYVRQNKRGAYKDFFVKRTILAADHPFSGTLNVKWRQLSTRRLYAGVHRIELLVNTVAVTEWTRQLQL